MRWGLASSKMRLGAVITVLSILVPIVVIACDARQEPGASGAETGPLVLRGETAPLSPIGEPGAAYELPDAHSRSEAAGEAGPRGLTGPPGPPGPPGPAATAVTGNSNGPAAQTASETDQEAVSIPLLSLQDDDGSFVFSVSPEGVLRVGTSSIFFDGVSDPNTISSTSALVISSGGSGVLTLDSANGAVALATGDFLAFEGETDDEAQVTLTVADPTEDRTITFPDASGEVLLDSTTGGLTLEAGSDGFSITGGTTPRTLEVAGGDLTLTTSGTSNVTLPNEGTLFTLSGEETLTNKTIKDSNIISSSIDVTSADIRRIDASTANISQLLIAKAASLEFVSIGNIDASTLVVSGTATFTGTVTGVTADLSSGGDLNGNELILDASGDTSITADTEDQIDFRVGGTDLVRMQTANAILLVSNAATAASGITFGTTGTANLYRSAANTLRTDDRLSSGGSLSFGGSLEFSDNTGSSTGGIVFGTVGTANLYRSAADTITTDDSFIVTGSLTVNSDIVVSGSLNLSSTAGTFGINFGSASNNANLYRSSDNLLRTDDSFVVGGSLTVNSNAVVAGSLNLSSTAGTFGINFGSASNNANLYRSSDNLLRTDDSFLVGGSLTVNSDAFVSGSLNLSSTAGTFGINFGSASNNANLYRTSDNLLRTDDSFIVSGSLTVNSNAVVAGSLNLSSTAGTFGISFGSASSNANLYRTSNNLLRTDDSFIVSGSLTVNSNAVVAGSLNLSSTAGTFGINFGSASNNANLYRTSDNLLRTDDSFLVGGSLTVNSNAVVSGSLNLSSTVGTFGISFGSASNNANLYRTSNNLLRTDDSFLVGGSLTVNSDVVVAGSLNLSSTAGTFGISFGSASNNANLYRSAADTLKTDDGLIVSGSLTVNSDAFVSGSLNLSSTAGTFGISFGSASNNANLYRTSNNLLRTDDSLIVDGSLTVNSNAVVSGSLNVTDKITLTGSLISTGGVSSGIRIITTLTGNQTVFQVGTSSNPTMRLTAQGSLFLDGGVMAAQGFQTDFGADVAEEFNVLDDAGAGDLVSAIGGVDVRKSSLPYETNVVGVIATNPGINLRLDLEVRSLSNPKPIALVGRVPVNVTNENGAIIVGDYIASSSRPGYGMKATKSGFVIGMALENFNKQAGQVLVKVATTYWEPLSSGEGTFASLAGTAETFSELMATKATFADLDVTTALFDNLVVTDGNFDLLQASSGTFGIMEAVSGSFVELQAIGATFDNLVAGSGSFTNLVVTSGTFEELVVDAGTFKNLVTTDGLTVGEGGDTTTIARHLSAVADLDFGLRANSCQDLALLVDGASTAGDTVAVGAPHTLNANISVTGFVSAPGKVTVRLCNPTTRLIDPASGSYRVDVWQHQ